jgi:hypothetical protein
VSASEFFGSGPLPTGVAPTDTIRRGRIGRCHPEALSGVCQAAAASFAGAWRPPRPLLLDVSRWWSGYRFRRGLPTRGLRGSARRALR